MIIIGNVYKFNVRNKFYAVKTEFTCPASTSKSQSSSSSMSLCHEQGLTPFPFNQCWNSSWQHASGSPWFLILIASNFAPNVSNSNWSPSACHLDATAEIILSFFPSDVFNIDKFFKVGVPSECRESTIIIAMPHSIIVTRAL